jgi:hypothetical protein
MQQGVETRFTRIGIDQIVFGAAELRGWIKTRPVSPNPVVEERIDPGRRWNRALIEIGIEEITVSGPFAVSPKIGISLRFQERPTESGLCQDLFEALLRKAYASSEVVYPLARAAILAQVFEQRRCVDTR